MEKERGKANMNHATRDQQLEKIALDHLFVATLESASAVQECTKIRGNDTSGKKR